METLQQILFLGIMVVLFVLGAKVDAWWRKREFDRVRTDYERQIADLKNEKERHATTLAESGFKQLQQQQRLYDTQIAEKDQQLQQLQRDLEAMKSSWQDHDKVLAEFKGATGAEAPTLIFKLVQLNQKLSSALAERWDQIESRLDESLQTTSRQIREQLDRARTALQADSHEIAAILNTRIPEDVRRQVFAELSRSRSEPAQDSARLIEDRTIR